MNYIPGIKNTFIFTLTNVAGVGSTTKPRLAILDGEKRARF